eukprot:m.90220 g.90220  ORF g.90220 m.90220 type:complete len:346 (+) comp20119_c0_seq5:629-1666(+)
MAWLISTRCSNRLVDGAQRRCVTSQYTSMMDAANRVTFEPRVSCFGGGANGRGLASLEIADGDEGSEPAVCCAAILFVVFFFAHLPNALRVACLCRGAALLAVDRRDAAAAAFGTAVGVCTAGCRTALWGSSRRCDGGAVLCAVLSLHSTTGAFHFQVGVGGVVGGAPGGSAVPFAPRPVTPVRHAGACSCSGGESVAPNCGRGELASRFPGRGDVFGATFLGDIVGEGDGGAGWTTFCGTVAGSGLVLGADSHVVVQLLLQLSIGSLTNLSNTAKIGQYSMGLDGNSVCVRVSAATSTVRRVRCSSRCSLSSTVCDVPHNAASASRICGQGDAWDRVRKNSRSP